MKTIIGRMSEFLDWADSEPLPKDVRAVISASLDKIIFCGDIDRKQCLALISEISSQAVQNLLETYLSEVPIVIVPDGMALEEPSIQGRVFDSFEELITSSEITSAIKTHTRSMRPGESRQDGFERLISHLLPCTSIFEFIDPFIGTKLLSQSPVIKWLFESISSDSNCDIRIVTRVPYRENESPTRAAGMRNMELSCDQLLANITDLPGANNVYVDFFERMPHNRFIHLKLHGGTSIFASIDHGIDAFLSDPIEELEPVKPLDRDELKDIQRSTKWLPSRLSKTGIVPLPSFGRGVLNTVTVAGPTWALP